MALLIVSDLHILHADDPTYRSLLSLMNQGVTPGDVLVLAGDIFDIFVGRKKIFLDRYRDFFEALRRAGERGIQLHYIEGNHDFLMGRAFDGIPNMKVHAREVHLDQSGKRFLIAHGDTVDHSDYGYRFLRFFFRSFLMRAFVRLAPGSWLDRIEKASSGYSRDRKPVVPTGLSAERRERLRKIFRSFAAHKLAEGFDFVALGHCHDLDEMNFQIGDRTAQYINVGFPPLHGSYLKWNPGEERIHRERFGVSE